MVIIYVWIIFQENFRLFVPKACKNWFDCRGLIFIKLRYWWRCWSVVHSQRLSKFIRENKQLLFLLSQKSQNMVVDCLFGTVQQNKCKTELLISANSSRQSRLRHSRDTNSRISIVTHAVFWDYARNYQFAKWRS